MKKPKKKKSKMLLFLIGYVIVLCAVLIWKIGYANTNPLSAGISVDGKTYPADITSFSVTNPEFDFAQLSQFSSLQSVDVTALEIDASKYQQIRSQVKEPVQVIWSVPFNGTRLPNNTTALSITSELEESEQSVLSYFTHLTDVTITNIDAFEKIYPLMKIIRETNPDVTIQCSTSLYGAPIDSHTETLVLNDIRLQNTDILCRAIEVFPRLTTIEMCRCGLSDEVMENLRESYPTINFVWIVNFLHYSIRTDVQVFSTLAIDYSRPGDSESFSPLFRYCTELRALDLGHMRITDISEIRNLKKLHTLILADNYISDISPLSDLKELNYVELFQNDISDFSPLLSLPHLQDLNICYNPHLQNPIIFTQCKTLQRLYCSHCGISRENRIAMQQGLPADCEFNWTAANCVYDGWRNNEKNTVIRNAFRTWRKVKEYPSWDNIVY